MTNRLSVRSYTRKVRGHAHLYHQLVLPLNGSIDIKVGKCAYLVSVGKGIIIRREEWHDFEAAEKAKFVVADLWDLPTNMAHTQHRLFQVDDTLLAYLDFISKSIFNGSFPDNESLLFSVFLSLVEKQTSVIRFDPRVEKVIAVMQSQPDSPHTIEALASKAFLSPTQFKKCFRKATGMSVMGYLLKIRMEKAQSLLRYSDLPIALVAHQVGYQDASSFSRRFLKHFGQTPREYKRS